MCIVIGRHGIPVQLLGSPGWLLSGHLLAQIKRNSVPIYGSGASSVLGIFDSFCYQPDENTQSLTSNVCLFKHFKS